MSPTTRARQQLAADNVRALHTAAPDQVADYVATLHSAANDALTRAMAMKSEAEAAHDEWRQLRGDAA